ncbi:hypothetical protein MUU74_07835 [Chryseobacterium daecheongense]|uniref:hypothetical protein n=1 Tax=Chryseobacterium daecheongense TaxID=192389 RepID=UPI001FD68F83|nr:hypothetical protein [Chryseobacterium daecheongense]UOU99851.1 hypothetical protein MUU74_07835 [Chryseobacterium daecheongense]
MKKVTYVSLLFLCYSCFDNSNKYKVEDFNQEDLKWFKPFQKENDTVIYVSERMEYDTLIFHKPESESDSTRSFETGYSNTNYLTVPYDITLGSYHKFALSGDGKTRCTQNFANMAKSSSGYDSLEIIFIGTLFNGENLQKIKKLNDSMYLFRGTDANYTGISVDEGINDFIFNTNKGVTEYVDYRKVKWKRK